MKNYIKYLEENPIKIILPLVIFLFSVLANLVVNLWDSSIGLTIGTLLFTLLMNCLIHLQVWGEYKQIEGFIDTIKAFFKWK